MKIHRHRQHHHQLCEPSQSTPAQPPAKKTVPNAQAPHKPNRQTLQRNSPPKPVTSPASAPPAASSEHPPTHRPNAPLPARMAKTPLSQRNRDPANRHNRQKRHLKTGLEQCRRRPHQNPQRRRPQRVQHTSVPRQQSCQQEHNRHKQSPLHWRTKPRQQRIPSRKRNRQQGSHPIPQLQSASTPEHQPRQQTHMHPRNHKQMKRPRAFKPQPQRMIQPRTIPKQHRVQHPGIISTQPHHLRQQPVRRRSRIPRHPPRSPALRRIKSALQTRGTAPQPHQLRSLHIRMNPNPLRQQIIRILPCPGIPIPLRNLQPHRSLHQIPTPQIRQSPQPCHRPWIARRTRRSTSHRTGCPTFGTCGRGVPTHHLIPHQSDPNPTPHGSHPCHIRRHLLHRLHLQIDSHRPSRLWLPLNPLRRIIVLISVLRASRQSPHPHHPPPNLSAQPIRISN
jgi:hypothetical protein